LFIPSALCNARNESTNDKTEIDMHPIHTFAILLNKHILIIPIKICSILLLLLASKLLFAQNLIPNSGFEEVSTCPVNMPENGIFATKPWYVIGDPSFVTPDLFHNNCPLSNQRAASSQFWSKRFSPYEGKGFMGLGSTIFVNGVFVSEGAGTRLEEPLKRERAYYFEMQVRNKGIDNVDNPLTKDCQTTPKKFIGIYLSNDSIRQTREISNNLITNTFSTSRLIFADSTNRINSSFMTDWHQYSDCFVATGEESHFGIIGPLGKFQAISSPCTISNQQRGFFHQFYYDIDNVLLVEMPMELTADTVICEEESTQVRLRRLVPMPMFDKAAFRWEDGSTDSVRTVQKTGLYTVNVIMPCTTIPLYLHVVSKDCATRIYAPTAFSPNGDGINDEFKPFVNAYWEISFYQLSIYDRWGNQVFVTHDISDSWNGNNASVGMYAWSLEYQLKDDENNGKQIKSGEIVLVR
jgi:gliding motility-associated-like protein